MKKTLLFCSMVITMTLMPQAIHAQSFWKQLGKVITGIVPPVSRTIINSIVPLCNVTNPPLLSKRD